MTYSRYLPIVVLSLTLGGLTVGQTDAAEISLTASERGWYDEFGNHTTSDHNYIAGNSGDGREFRNFFVYTLPDSDTLVGKGAGAGEVVVSAQLKLRTFTAVTDDTSENFELYDVSTSIGTLTSGGGGVSGFEDLGSGDSYGNATFTDSDDSIVMTIELNSSAIAEINSSLGGLFAMGGAVTTLDSSISESIFGGGGMFDPTNGDSLLVLQTGIVPEPGSAWIAIALLGGLGNTRVGRSRLLVG